MIFGCAERSAVGGGLTALTAAVARCAAGCANALLQSQVKPVGDKYSALRVLPNRLIVPGKRGKQK